MKYYTNITRYGVNLLYRGYENGERVQKKIRYKPSLFVPSPKGTTSKFKSLYGGNVSPIEFNDMSEAADFIKQYEEVPNYPVSGMSNFVLQYIGTAFPRDITFERERINVTTIDIEVASDEGFPFPEQFTASYEFIEV